MSVFSSNRRGSLLSTAIFVYAATAPVNGYFGGSLYAKMGGKVWIRQMLLSAFLLPILVCGTAFVINFIAIYYHASRAIPFGTMVSLAMNISCLELKVQYSDNCSKKGTKIYLALFLFDLGCGDLHLYLRDLTADPGGHCART